MHADMQHNMHASGGFPLSAQQRFLPWHRAYLKTVELLLREYEPKTFIPYWDWTVDPVPSWLSPPSNVPLPMEIGTSMSVMVKRSSPSGGFPTRKMVQSALAIPNYTRFAQRLETLHDQVHSAFGSSTVAQLMIAPADPLFFLHHANVDRIWNNWQLRFPGKNPTLNADDRVMDPFSYKESEVRSIRAIGYSYQ